MRWWVWSSSLDNIPFPQSPPHLLLDEDFNIRLDGSHLSCLKVKQISVKAFTTITQARVKVSQRTAFHAIHAKLLQDVFISFPSLVTDYNRSVPFRSTKTLLESLPTSSGAAYACPTLSSMLENAGIRVVLAIELFDTLQHQRNVIERLTLPNAVLQDKLGRSITAA